jgi:hypothetical protein
MAAVSDEDRQELLARALTIAQDTAMRDKRHALGLWVPETLSLRLTRCFLLEQGSASWSQRARTSGPGLTSGGWPADGWAPPAAGS